MKPDFSKFGMKAVMMGLLFCAQKNLRQDGYITPFVFLLKEVRGLQVMTPVLMDFSDDITKRVSTAMVKAMMAMEKIDAYIMVTEAWMATVDKGEPIGVLPVKARDDKQEGICLSAGTPMLSLSLTQVFHRAENGNGPKFEFEEEVFCDSNDSVFYPEHWKNKN